MKRTFTTAVLGLAALFANSATVQADNYDGYYSDTCCAQPCYYNSCCCDCFWGDAEFLYWKIQDSPQPVPLAFESPNLPSSLDDPSAHIVLGGNKIKTDWSPGARFALGGWLDSCRTLGVEASYFILPYQSKKHTVHGSGDIGEEFLFVPFFDVFNNIESATLVAGPFPSFPGPIDGSVSRKLRNRMQGAELNGIWALPTCVCALNIDLIAGFRWWNFDESFTFKTDSTFQAIPTSIFKTKDKFAAQNNFYGGQIGIGLNYNCDCFFANVIGKVALGENYYQLNIHGNLLTNQFPPDPFAKNSDEFEGGIFAQGTNIGKHKKNQFCVIPEVEANFGWQVTECFRVKVGYTFLWASKVLRPAKQIDRNINPTQSVAITHNPFAELIGTPAPKALSKTNSLWVQGVSAGIDFSF